MQPVRLPAERNERSMTAKLVPASKAAKHLGISKHTFEKRRKAGDPLYQPDHVDPDSGRRTAAVTGRPVRGAR